MKTLKILAIAGMLYISDAAFGQQARINGEIKGLGDTELSIFHYEGNEGKTTSVKVTDGKFTWEAPMPIPQQITIKFPKTLFFAFVEQGNMKITGHADSLGKLKLTGSKIQDEADAYNKSIEPLTSELTQIQQKYGKLSSEEKVPVQRRLSDVRAQKRMAADNYIIAHPESFFSVILVTERSSAGEYKDVQDLYDRLGKNIKLTFEGKRLAERIVVLKRSAIGTPMFDFTQNDTEGRPVSFAAFKGKYVLIDFWASWCGPCRAQNPNLLKVYHKFKEKNFTVIGISLDDKGESWKKAIKDDGMPWTQLSDLKGWKNEVSTYYGIRGIPSTLLVDPKGNIIARDLKGEALNKKLEDLFNN